MAYRDVDDMQVGVWVLFDADNSVLGALHRFDSFLLLRIFFFFGFLLYFYCFDVN